MAAAPTRPADTTDYSSELLAFIRQLATATGDLSKMTCPTFLLNGQSLLEYSLYWSDYPALFFDITQKTGNAQMVCVVRWFMSTLYASYHSRCSGDNSEKKPFNPVLGESIACDWNDTSNQGWGSSKMMVEQVSHHPPVSAFSIKMPAVRDPKKPFIQMQGHCGQRTSFSTGAIKVSQVGSCRITVQIPGAKDVEYVIFPLPDLSVAGLMSGKIFVELLGSTKIVGSNNTEAEIEFIPKGWFSGYYFKIKGHIRDKGAATPSHTLTGDWTVVTQVVPANKEPQLLFNAIELAAYPRTYRPIEQQTELESHKLWGEVTTAIREKRYQQASDMKTIIEEGQRSIRKSRADANASWEPQFFKFTVEAGKTDGATPRDPQQHGEGAANELGHWLIKE